MGVEVVLARVSALCTLIGTVTFLVGFSTPWWLRATAVDSYAGLWRNCVGDHCTSTINIDIGDWLIACQALSITALLTSLMTIGLSIAMMQKSRDSKSPAARIGVIATSLITGLALAVTLAAYYLQHHLMYPEETYALSVSFYLVLVADSLFLAVAILLTLLSVALGCCCRSSSSSS